jgi:hypothetical protein
MAPTEAPGLSVSIFMRRKCRRLYIIKNPIIKGTEAGKSYSGMYSLTAKCAESRDRVISAEWIKYRISSEDIQD